MARAPLILTGAAFAALALWAFAAHASIDESTGLQETDMGDTPADVPPDETAAGVSDWEDGTMNTDTTPEQMLDAFLYMIRACEHRLADVVSGADYFTYYGGSRFSDTSDHPVLTGEKVGVSLANLGPAYAGKVSTAAGAYQINVPTWREVRQAGAWGPYLSDFSPSSQDEAARRLLMRNGAMPYVLSGDTQRAIAKASGTWASLPGSTAGQGGRTLDYALARYGDGLQVG